MNCSVGVVILNYKNYFETIECVSCFLKQSYAHYEIVVVDNGSGNESVQEIRKEFETVNRFHLLASETNVGFARGNNLGIDYCRKKLKCDFVIVINSDTVVSEDFIEKLVTAYKPGAGVVVPSVKQPDGCWQQPSVNCDNLGRTIGKKYFEIMLMLVLDSPIAVVFRKHSSKTSKKSGSEEPAAARYYLQGCSYMLTPDFFEKYNRLYPKTFLYWEELDLLWYLKQANLVSCRADEALVIHKGGASTEYCIPPKSVLKARHKRILSGMVASTPLFLKDYHGIKRVYDVD